MKGPAALLLFTSCFLGAAAALGGCSDPAQPAPVSGFGGATSGAVGTGGPTTGAGGAMGTVVSTGGPTTGSTSSTGAPTTGSTSTGGLTTAGLTTGSTGSTSTGSTSMGSTSTGGLTTGNAMGTTGGMATTGGATTGGTCDTSGGGTVIDPTFATFKAIIAYSNPTCAASDCHGNNEANALNLLGDDATIYNNLLNTMSVACGNIPVVDPGYPENSALVMLLKGPCGDLERMPRLCNDIDCNCVPDNYIAAIEQWIANDAPFP